MALILSGTNGITSVNGSAAAPSVTGTDTDTGIVYGTNTITLSTNGTAGLVQDASQNLGIGVTPSAWNSANKVLQFAYAGTVAGGTTLDLYCNAYVNSGGTSKYIDSYAYASKYTQYNGAHQWHNTTSTQGAGNTVTWSQAMTLDASGNLGIGTTSPSSYGQLTSYTATGGKASLACISTYTAGTGAAATITAGDNSGSHSGGYGLKIFDKTDNGGGAQEGYGLYVAAPYDGSHSSGNNYALQKFGVYVDDLYGYYGVNSTYTWGVYAKGGAGNYFASNVLVGTTDAGDTTGNGIKLWPNGGIPRISMVGNSVSSGQYPFMIRSSSNNTWRMYIDWAGNIYAQNTAITSLSDVRLKENIRDLETGLDKVLALQPRRFDWKEGKGQDKKDVAGFIAQEVEAVLPELVTTGLDEDESGDKYKMLAPAMLIPTLVKAIQEQQAIITSLTARIEALEA